MIRAIVGTIILLCAAIALGHSLPDWADFTRGPTPGETLDSYLQHVDLNKAVAAAVGGVIGFAMMSWPPKRRILSVEMPSTPPSKQPPLA
jgi:hypothetical protein